jgi:hypothetical protein
MPNVRRAGGVQRAARWRGYRAGDVQRAARRRGYHTGEVHIREAGEQPPAHLGVPGLRHVHAHSFTG